MKVRIFIIICTLLIGSDSCELKSKLFLQNTFLLFHRNKSTVKPWKQLPVHCQSLVHHDSYSRTETSCKIWSVSLCYSVAHKVTEQNHESHFQTVSFTAASHQLVCRPDVSACLLLLSGLPTKEPPASPKNNKKKPKNIYSVQTYLLSLPLNSAPLLIWLLITRIRHSILQEELATSILKAASDKHWASAISQADKETSKSLTDFFSSLVAGEGWVRWSGSPATLTSFKGPLCKICSELWFLDQ